MLPYRNCVAIFLVKNNKIFAGQRVDIARAWQLPQGGVEDGENRLDAAKRELFEETNVSTIKLLAASNQYKYDFPTSIRHKIFKKRGNLMYSGQEVSFFAFDFLGNDREINLEKTAKEFSNWKWMQVDELLQKIIYFKKPIYEQAVAEFKAKKIAGFDPSLDNLQLC